MRNNRLKYIIVTVTMILTMLVLTNASAFAAELPVLTLNNINEGVTKDVEPKKPEPKKPTPKKPKKPLPQTGDNYVVPALIVAVAGALGLSVYKMKKIDSII